MERRDYVTTDSLLVIVITGPVGSGKSTTAWALHDLLSERRIPSALVDIDYLRCAWPQVTPWNAQLGYDNFAAIAVNHRKIGVRCFVVADVVETPEQRHEYEQAVPGSRVVVVRLNVVLENVLMRLHARERTPDGLAWHLNRAGELQTLMESRQIGDLVVDIDNHTPDEVAYDIFTRLDLDSRQRL
jgi:adenylylsulfate kinase-like enzyme